MVLTADYNCAHFVSDAWLQETGQVIDHLMRGFLAPAAERVVTPNLANSMVRLERPRSPCIVLFRRRVGSPHVGMFVRGRVFHLTDSGPIRQALDIAQVGYYKTRFYAPR